MGAKEAISGGYIESWQHYTKNWEVADLEKRAALVVGVREGNIGEAIADELSETGFGRVHTRDIVSRRSDGRDTPLNLNDQRTLNSTRFDRYDTLVLANGMTNLAWLEDQNLNDDRIEAVISNKLTASVKAVSEFAKQTIDSPEIKHIVLIGSMAHRSVLNASAPYCAACAGLMHFARCAAWELAPKGFRVFIVNPSNVEGTPMTEETIKGIESYRGVDRKQAEEYWGAVRALPEWLKREDIAVLVRRLVTDPEMRWLAGSALDLGGGLR